MLFCKLRTSRRGFWVVVCLVLIMLIGHGPWRVPGGCPRAEGQGNDTTAWESASGDAGFSGPTTCGSTRSSYGDCTGCR